MLRAVPALARPDRRADGPHGSADVRADGGAHGVGRHLIRSPQMISGWLCAKVEHILKPTRATDPTRINDIEHVSGLPHSERRVKPARHEQFLNPYHSITDAAPEMLLGKSNIAKEPAKFSSTSRQIPRRNKVITKFTENPVETNRIRT